jgi:YD repeat-containing protein
MPVTTGFSRIEWGNSSLWTAGSNTRFQPATVSKPAPETNLSYAYDSWRGIKTITQSPDVHTFGYDFLGRLTSIDRPWADDTLSYTYNDAARSVTRTRLRRIERDHHCGCLWQAPVHSQGPRHSIPLSSKKIS